jgi:sugar phosphate isomerase/epimerase
MPERPLVLCHHTIRDAPFEERAAAAAAGGYDGLGLNLRAYRTLQADGMTDAAMLEALARHDQRIVEMEALAGWSDGGEAAERSRRAEATAFHLADVFGASYLQAIGPYTGTLDDAAAAFAALCDRAAEHGVRVGIEFLPFTNIADAATAAELVGRADRPNGGICVDSWHFFRGTPDFDQLAAVPGERVFDIQLNDGTLVPEHDDYLEDCLRNRRCPGDGEFELRRFLDTLAASGVDAPVSAEVISLALDELPPDAAALRVAETSRAVLAPTPWH